MQFQQTGDALRIALVGAGEVGTALLRLLLEEPGVTVVGVADVKPDAPGVVLARERGIPIEIRPRDVFSFRPTMVIECTGDLSVFQDLSSLKPVGTDLIGGPGFRLMWRLLASKEYAFRGLSALHSITTAVGAVLDLPKVLETALTEAMALTHARRGLLQLLDPGSQELVVKAHRGFNHRFLRELPRLHLSESHPAGAESMADVTLVSVEAEPDEARRAALMGEGIHCYALVPLQARDRLIGMMLLADPPGRASRRASGRGSRRSGSRSAAPPGERACSRNRSGALASRRP